MTLADLSRVLPSEQEIAQLRETIKGESDRGMALIAGALVESGLFWAIAMRFADWGEVQRNGVFHDLGAPLSSFSSKIRVGHSLHIFGPETNAGLGVVKDIRNAFAHALRPLDFTHPTVAAACKKLPLPAELRKPDQSARDEYYLYTNYAFARLINNGYQNQGKTFQTDIP